VISQEFSSGTPCDLFEDVPEEMAKLDADDYKYNSDSDLDSDLDSDEESLDKGKGKNIARSMSEERYFPNHSHDNVCSGPQ
jgi:hypothetical protein